MRFNLVIVFFLSAIAVSGQSPIKIIPQPARILASGPPVTLPKNIVIDKGASPAGTRAILILSEKLSGGGHTVNLQSLPSGTSANVLLQLNAKRDSALGDEGYQLTVNAKQIILRANNQRGLFYSVQSLLQLLPPEVERLQSSSPAVWTLPQVDLIDYPRFHWRGLMFDVTRHFFKKEEVKAVIDQMALFKFNLLHLHLSDDEGWRIEVKSLPRLTSVGAFRVNKVGYFGTFSAPLPGEPATYGGFYTQEDIKELVKYAADRFVDILPEIDVPGHSLAAVVSYPELSCTPEADRYRVRSGEQIMDWSHGAPPVAMVDNTLCPANEKVYEFLDKVLTELAPLFPFGYFHLGGDECPKNYWQKSDEIKALMDREGIRTMEQVQGYFEKRVEKILVSKGKKFIGWDEILEGGVAPSAAVMSWRGTKSGAEAVKLKHQVVMSPSSFCYLDYMQADAITEPKVYASLRLNKAYEFNPAPDTLDQHYILGGQANLWTEQVYTLRHAEYMLWPRAMAISEALWSPPSVKNWQAFVTKTEHQFERFDQAEINYSKAMYDPIFTSTLLANQLQVTLGTEVGGLTIHYSFDSSFPDRFYPSYQGPLEVPKDASLLRVITYRGKTAIGRMITMPVEELRKRARRR